MSGKFKTLGASGLIVVLATSLWLARRHLPRLTSRPPRPVPLTNLANYRKDSRVNLEAPVGRIYWGDIGPLDFARHVSAVGEFDCIAIAPRPLDLANFDSNQPVRSLDALLSTARRKFKELLWERHDGWILFYFGQKRDLELLKRSSASLPPLMVSARGSFNLLSLLAEIGGVKVKVDPSVLRRRDALLAQHKRNRARYPYWGRGYFEPESFSYPQEPSLGTRLTFSLVQPTALREVMERAAVTLGGECEQCGDTWVVRKRVNGQQLISEVERLMSDLHSEGPSEDSEAVQGLVAVGRPAIPRLLKALDPQQPALSSSAARVLAELKAKECVPQLLVLWRKMKKPKPGEETGWNQESPRETLVNALGTLGDRRATNVLVKAATDQEEQDSLRMAARQALLKLNAVEALASDTRRTIDPPHERFQCVLRARKQAPGLTQHAPHNTCDIKAQCRDEHGRHWALFGCDKLGDSRDLWLATSPEGKTWEEFYFTGIQDTVQQWYGGGGGPSRYGLAVAQGVVKLSLPNLNPGYAYTRVKVGNTWRTVTKRVAPKPVVRTVSLMALQKDADHDGLTDLVERRLGTDAAKPDTDGDKVADDVDGNPLVRPSSGKTDREVILRILFAHLFGGDPSEEPLVIQATKPLRQEFHGYSGPVIPVSDESPEWLVRALTNSRALHFGGPRSTSTTVLRVDGPVCFNESRTKAQVQFWLTGLRSPYPYDGGEGRSDQIALFERREDRWVLIKVRRWDWVSAQR